MEFSSCLTINVKGKVLGVVLFDTNLLEESSYMSLWAVCRHLVIDTDILIELLIYFLMSY